MQATSQRLLAAVLVAVAMLAATLVSARPAAADCWYCEAFVDDSFRSEYRTSGHDFGWMPFTVRLGWVPTTNVTVGYRTKIGPSATGGEDYTSKIGTVTVPAGKTAATFYVTVLPDTDAESNEWFRVELMSTSSGHLGDGDVHHDELGTGWILDDDPARLSVVDARPVNEYHDLSFTVRLSAALDHEVKVKVGTQTPAAAGNATPGADYGSWSTLLTFAPGETTKTFTVDVFNDQAIHEATERMRVHLFHNSGALIADSEAWGTIYEVDFIS